MGAIRLTVDYVLLMIRHSASSEQQVCARRLRWLIGQNKQAYTELFYRFYFRDISNDLNVPLKEFQISKESESSSTRLIPRSAGPRAKSRAVQINSRTLRLLFSSMQFAEDVTNYLDHYFVLESRGRPNSEANVRDFDWSLRNWFRAVDKDLARATHRAAPRGQALRSRVESRKSLSRKAQSPAQSRAQRVREHILTKKKLPLPWTKNELVEAACEVKKIIRSHRFDKARRHL